MQVFKTSLKQPFFQQIVCDNLDAFFIRNFVATKPINAHLVEAFAELANGVRYDRDALKHLSCDCVDYIQQLDEHLLVKSRFTLCFYVSTRARHGVQAAWSQKSHVWTSLLTLFSCSCSPIKILILQVSLLQVFDCEKACIDPFTFDSKQVVKASSSFI